MDPFSITSGAMGILGVSAQILKLCYSIYDYYGGVKNAPQAMRDIMKELEALDPVLYQLRVLALRSQPIPLLQEFSKQGGVIEMCQRELQELADGLQKRIAARGFHGKVGRLTWPLSEAETTKHLLGIQRMKSTILLGLQADSLSASHEVLQLARKVDSSLSQIYNATEEITDSLEYREAEKKRREVLKFKWLHSDDFKERHQLIQDNRQEGTGEWLLRSEEFINWKEGISSRILLGLGIAGAGKTFLSSRVIDHLEDVTEGGVAYVYFNYQDQQSPTRIMASIVKQLLCKLPSATPLPEIVNDLHSKLAPDKKASQDQLRSVLSSVVSLFPSTFLIFDAIDECEEGLRTQILSLLLWIETLGEKVFLFIISRPLADLKDILTDAVEVKLSAHPEDISAYLEARIEQTRPLRPTKTPPLMVRYKSKIIPEVRNSAGEMFLLAKFHFDFLSQKINARKLLNAIETLKNPSSRVDALEQCYKRVVDGIRARDENDGLALDVLALLSRATTPLRINELQDALAVVPGELELDPLNVTSAETLVDICGGLVEIDHHSKTIGLAHYTIKQYLVNEKVSPILKEANMRTAIFCVAYLSLSHIPGDTRNLKSSVWRRSPFAFLRYAVSNISYHLRCNEPDERLTTMTLQFLKSPKSLAMYVEVLSWITVGHGIPKGITPLRVGSMIGYIPVVEALLGEREGEPSEEDKVHSTEVHWAAYGGRPEVIQLLLDRGAYHSSVDSLGRTPGSIAARAGHVKVLRCLLDNGAALLERDKKGKTPLHFAAESGHSDAVELLLENGMELELADNRGWTAMNYAVSSRNATVVKMLLDRGAMSSGIIEGNESDFGFHKLLPLFLARKEYSTGVITSSMETALHLAAKHNYPELGHQLLQTEQDPSITDINGTTPLHWAVLHRSTELAEALLLKEANVAAADKNGETPLHWAVSRRASGGYGNFSSLLRTIGLPGQDSRAMISLLLESGAPISYPNSKGRTPIHKAAFRGDADIVRILARKGAELSTRDKEGQTPLHTAIHQDKLLTSRILIDAGADISIPDAGGRTPLHVALYKGKIEISRALIQKGATISGHTRDSKGHTPLYMAARWNCPDIVAFLIDGGADISTPDNLGDTPLHITSDARIAGILIDRGAGVSTLNNARQTPLHTALSRKDTAVANFLIERGGANILVQDGMGQTLLHIAVKRDLPAVADTLIKEGAETSIPDAEGRTALHLAVDTENIKLARTLINNGSDVSAQDKIGQTPLHWAIDKRYQEIAHLLLEKGTDIKIQDNMGHTPLHIAVKREITDIFHALVGKGADLSLQSNKGQTPLHMAVKTDSIEISRTLIDKGSDIARRDTHGQTPLQVAVRWNNIELTRLLIEKGADVCTRNNLGRTPVHHLVDASGPTSAFELDGPTEEILELLTKNGADLSAADNLGWTPLHVAASGARKHGVELLLRLGADVSSSDNEGRTPLDVARKGSAESAGFDRHKYIVKLLEDELQKREGVCSSYAGSISVEG